MKSSIILYEGGPFISLKFVRMLKTDIKAYQIEFLLQSKFRGAIVAHFEILRSVLIS